MKHLTFLTLIALATSTASARPIPQSSAVQAIIGEAGGEPYAAQLAVASAIRHRGSLQGIYGLTNPSVAHASHRQRRLATQAWLESKIHDTAPGLRYFGCASDARYFNAIGLHPALQIGGITFWH